MKIIVSFLTAFFSLSLAANFPFDDFDDFPFDQLEELIRACFDHEYSGPISYLEEALFSVHGIDDDKDVTITFKVEGFPSRLSCDLIWIENMQDPNLSKGDIRSVKVSDSSNIRRAYDGGKTEIKIRIDLNDEIDHIMIESLRPNGLVSGKFIKAFICMLIERLVSFEGEMFNPVNVIIKEDDSSNRELYWLQKGEGKTYFEQEWQLEYECLFDLPYQQMLSLSHVSEQAVNLPATMSLNHFPTLQETFQTYRPVPTLQENKTFVFNQRFIGFLELYRSEKREGYFQTMTIWQVLQEFIPRWNLAPDVTHEEKIMMARNTFVYFFKNHPNFTAIARRVLHGYDENCNSMSGIPIQQNQHQQRFNFRFRRQYLPRPPEPPENDFSERSVESSFWDQHYFDIIFLTLILNIFISLLCICDLKRHQESHLDFYIEL